MLNGMRKILISFIVPVHPAWAPYVHRMLRSLAHQTNTEAFEVVFGVDGGDPDGALADVAALDWPFPVFTVDSPRAGGDFPHRNHARNAAIAHSRGVYCWIVDCDFIWHEHAIEHAVALIEAAAESGEFICATPVLKRIVLEEDIYLPHTSVWAEDPAGAKPSAFAAALKTDDGEWDGQAGLYSPDAGPRLVSGRPQEGFPLVPRIVVDAMGGFDERFVRWGGNKIEFCYRLSSLSSVGLPYRVLSSVAAWHQPHPQDPNKPLTDPHRKANHALYRQCLAEVRAGADWWVKQRAAVTRALLEAREAVTGKAPVAPAVTDAAVPRTKDASVVRVGLVTVADRRKGIARDIDLIEMALTSGPMRRRGKPDPVITRYTLDAPHKFMRAPCASLEGDSWQSFLTGVDVIVISEFMPARAINAALAAGVRVIYIPNADWCEIGGDVEQWVRLTRAFVERGVSVLAKSPGFASELEMRSIGAKRIAWTDLGPVARSRPAPAEDRPIRFFASIGMGGWQNRRRTSTIIEAWRLADVGGRATLTIKSARPLSEVLPEQVDLTGIEVIEEDWTRQQIEAAWLEHDVVLYPTAWDGFGLSLAEALNAGCPVLATNVWPMNEQVIDGHNGRLLVTDGDGDGDGGSWTRGLSVGKMRLAPIGIVSAQSLADGIREMLDPLAVRALTCPQPSQRLLRQRAMVTHLRQHILDETEPAVLVVTGTGDTTAGGIRSERWWVEALKAAGFKVHVLSDSEIHVADAGLRVDFAIVGKASPVDVERVRVLIGRAAPVICWHLDLTDYTEQRMAWQQQMTRAADLCLVSERDLDRFPDGRIEFMPAGQEIAPLRMGLPAPVTEVDNIVFLGGCHGAGDVRAKLIRSIGLTLASDGIALKIYGDPAGWQAAGLMSEGRAHGAEAGKAYEGSVALCVSRSTDRDGYTSNRLFNAMAGGSVPAILDFSGRTDLVPDNCAIAFNSPEELAANLANLDTDALGRIQRAAYEHVWRYHTWGDRVLALLNLDFKRRETSIQATPLGAPQFQGMWDQRGKRLGRRAVGHISWTQAQFEELTGQWWKKFKRHLSARLKPGMTLLDYGCGIGRFTSRIAAQMPVNVVGVDIAKSMLDMARTAHPTLDFRLLRPGAPLPFADNSLTALFTCTVLQHVPDDEMEILAAELHRVLAPGAAIFLFENCHRARVRSSHSGHVVFRPEGEYRQMFPGIVEIESWMVEGEKHAILAGRHAG